MDVEQRALRRDGAPFHLSPQQLQMLSELLPHAGQTVSRQTLIDTVWNGRAITDYAMDKAVSRLRAALGCEDDGPFDIVADKGRGFHFRGHIVWADTPDGVVPAERGAAPRVANAGGVPASAEEQAIVLDRLTAGVSVFQRRKGHRDRDQQARPVPVHQHPDRKLQRGVGMEVERGEGAEDGAADLELGHQLADPLFRRFSPLFLFTRRLRHFLADLPPFRLRLHRQFQRIPALYQLLPAIG